MKRREVLLSALEEVQVRVCAYGSKERCDCKYGIKNEGDLAKNHFYSGEQTGCPEVREIIAVLKEMTDIEYEKIAKRINRKIKKAAKEFFKENPNFFDNITKEKKDEQR